MALGAGTTAVVTGANTGLGLATAIGIARTGPRVILAVRSSTKGAAAAAEIRGAVPGADVEVMELDLASLASVRAFAAALTDRVDRLDVLVNNAGVTMMKRTLTADGFEATFGVNHLGHFLLTNLLVDRLAAAGDGRVVVVASDAHRLARRELDLDGRRAGRRYGAMRVYGESKLANILFTREAARRWADRGITVNCVHPGFVATRLGRDGDGGRLGELAMRLGRPFARTPEQGAETSVFLATSPTVAGVNGQYFANSRPASPSAAARDDDAARRLWEHSETLVGG